MINKHRYINNLDKINSWVVSRIPASFSNGVKNSAAINNKNNVRKMPLTMKRF